MSSSKIQIPKSKEMQVFGWIKNECTKFKIQNFPVAISYIVFLYFYLKEALKIKDTKDYNIHHYGVIINEDTFITKKNAYKWFTIWGDKLIHKNNRKYIWNLRCESFFDLPKIAIGISSKMKPELEKSIVYDAFFSTRPSKRFKDHYYYCITSNGSKIRQEGGEREEEQRYEYLDGNNNYKPARWRYTTELEMTLDCTTKKNKLKFIINGDYIKYFNFNDVKFDNQNIYTLCISFRLFTVKSIHLQKFTEIVDVQG